MSDETVQEGHQYPNVVRQLQDDGGTNQDSEYWWYNNGGTYPWPGIVPPVGRQLIANSTPVRNINVDEFDLVVDSTVADEQIYAAVFDSAVDADDPVTVREGRGALWSGGQTSVVGENIFAVTGVVPSGKFYGFAQENWTPGDVTVPYTVETTDSFDFESKGVQPAFSQFVLHYVFTADANSADLDFEEFAIRLKKNTSSKLLVSKSGTNLAASIAGSGVTLTTPMSFLNGETVSIKVRVGTQNGFALWLDNVKVSDPYTGGTDGEVNAVEMGFLDASWIPATLQKFRFINEELTDAEVEALT